MTQPALSSGSIENWLPAFANPPREFGPVALWLWNDVLDPPQVMRQLELMAEQGLTTAIIRAWNGLRTSPDSTAYQQRVAQAVSEAIRLNMALWLHADVPDNLELPTYALAASPPIEIAPELRAQELVKAEVPLERAAGWAEAYTATSWPAGTLVALLLASADGSAVVDLTAHPDAPQDANLPPDPDGSAGWRLIAFVQRPSAADSQGRFRYDPLSTSATEAYLHARFVPYEALCGDKAGQALKGFVVSAPPLFRQADGTEEALPWTTAFVEEFARRQNYDLRPHLLALWEARTDAGRIRSDYYTVLSEMLAAGFYAPARAWCEARGFQLAALPDLSGDLSKQVATLGNPLTILRAAHIPGSGDALSKTLSPFDAEMSATFLTAAATHNAEQQSSFALVGAGAGWQQTLRDLKAQTERAFASGATTPVLPSFHFSIEKTRRDDAPPSLFFHNTFWPLFSSYSVPQRRLAYALAQGVASADVGLYVPLRAAWEDLPPGRLASPDFAAEREGKTALRRTQDIFERTFTLLRANQWEVALLDDHAIAEAEARDGTLRVGAQTLRALVLPDVHVLPVAVARKLRAFVESGGLLATVGNPPERGTSNGDEILRGLLTTLFTGGAADIFGTILQPLGAGLVARVPAGVGPLQTLLAERLTPRLILAKRDPGIRHVCRQGKDFDLFFLSCLPGERRGMVYAAFYANGSPLRLDPDTGHRTRLTFAENAPADRMFPIDLSSGSALIAFVPEKVTAGSPVPERISLLSAWNLNLRWNITLTDTLIQTELRPWAELGRPYFTGRAEYATTVRLPGRQEVPYNRMLLDLGDVREWAQVWVNGVRAGQRIHPPFTFDITTVVRTGENEIQVTVGNTPANAFHQEERLSGLLGPVSLRALDVQR